jgi:hypothetical protein
MQTKVIQRSNANGYGLRPKRPSFAYREEKIMGTLEWVLLIVVLLFLFGGGGFYWSRRRA